MKILLLEDNKRLNETVVKKLTHLGFNVDSFEDGLKALEAIDNGYDCFILDINVPGKDGLKILKDIFTFYPDIPTIIISSDIELDTIKKAYDIGCYDYLKKPFYIDELEIKIKRLTGCKFTKINLGEDFLFDTKTETLLKNEVEQKLTKKERLFLSVLAKRVGEKVSFRDIETFVWEGDIASMDSIRAMVMRLRKKLPKDIIETVVDFGYVLNGKDSF